MKRKIFDLAARRIYMRPWRTEISAPAQLGGIIGGLLITFYGGGLITRYWGMLTGLIVSSFAASFFILAVMFCHPVTGRELARKAGFRKLEKKNWKPILLGLALITVVSPLLTLSWQQILESLHIPFEQEQGLVQLVKGADAETCCKLFLLTTVAVPLAEELIFRRCLYGLLLKISAPAAFVGTAVIFAAAHGFLLGVPGLCFIGFIFQILCNTTRNLWSAVICHACHNAIVITLAALSTSV